MKRAAAMILAVLMMIQLMPAQAETFSDWFQVEIDETPVYHTVRFVADGEEISSVSVADGSSLSSVPEGPAKSGYLFTGWFADEQAVAAGTVVTSDMTAEAVYAQDESSKKGEKFSYADKGTYASIAISGTYQKNQKPRASRNDRVSGSASTVLEAWTVSNIKNNTSLTLEAVITAVPVSGAVSAYTVVNGAIDKKVASGLTVGDKVVFDLSMKGAVGIALVAEKAEVGEDEAALVEGALYANEHLYLTGKIPGNGIIDVQPVTVSIAGEKVLAAYDIRIYTNANQQKKGKTWQPAGEKVQVHFYNKAFEGQVNIYHVSDAKSGPEYVGTVEADDGWVVFEADSFSTYAITQSIEQEVTIGGATYKITVTYDKKAGIPDGSKLDVKELRADDYLDAAASALGWTEDDEIVYAKFLDISIVCDGKKVEPKTPVSVTVELLDVKEGAEALEVVHFRNRGAEKVDSTASGDGSVTFKADSFSVFGFGSVLRSLLSWTSDAVSYTIQGFSTLFNPTYTAIDVALEEGLEVLSAYNVESFLGSMLSALYVKVSTALDLDSRESVVVYSVKDGAVADVLAEGRNVDESLALGSADGFAVVLDTGYRRKVFDLGSVVLDGMMPKAAEAEAVAADADVEGVLLAAFDITIEENGIDYQPDGDHPVEVSIAVGEVGDPSALRVWHILEDGTREEITEFTVADGKVLFTAAGFSVYAIVDVDENIHKVRVKYVFELDDDTPYTFQNTAGQTVDNQIIKNGESLENVGMPDIDANGQTFNGWFIYKDGVMTGYQILFDRAISISAGAVSTSISSTSVEIADADNQAIQDETLPDYTIHVRPSFGDVAYITFWNEVDGNIIYSKIQVPKGATYNINDQAAIPPDAIKEIDPDTGEVIYTPVSYAFFGWSETPGDHLETGGNPDDRPLVSNPMVTVNEDMEFFPVFKLSHWVSFVTAPVGSGATYYSPVFILSGNTAASAMPTTTPHWDGHTFVGWFDTPDDDYLSVGETNSGAWNFNQTLDDDVTLYAHWNAGTANVTIIRWLQQVTDSKNATDSQKNYEYGGQVNQMVEVNSTVYPTAFDDVEGFMINSAKSDKSVVVKPDGTSVLNIYYDRKLMTMVFSGLGNQQGTYYTETTGNSGTQYGYVNGQYVELTRGTATTVYTYTTQNYISGAGIDHDNSPAKYGVVNGEFTRVYWRSYNGVWSTSQYGTVSSSNTYTGEVYTIGSNIIYTGTRYTRSGYSAPYTYTPTTNNSANTTYYGTIDNGHVPLTRSTETVYPWTYVDSNGVTQTYTGPRYTQTTANNTTVYTGLYGQTLEQNGYSWPSGTWRYTDNGSSYGMSYLGQFVFPITGSTIIFSQQGTNTKEIRFYLQNVDGTYPTTPTDTGYVEYNGYNSTFYFTEKYDGFTVKQYRLGNGNWQTAAVDGSVTYGNSVLHIRYERLKYPVKYLDSRNGTELSDVPALSMVYGADLADANPNVTTLTPPTSQYEWDGHWYTDQDCTTIALFSDDTSRNGELGNYTSIDTEARTVTYGTGPYATTYSYQVLGTMPNHEISVYAGWNEIWYWVKLEPDGGALTSTESTWFWETLGDLVEEYHDVTRQYVEDPDGEWYYHYDELNPDTELNQYGTNVRKAYYYKADGTGLPEGVSLPAGGAAAWSYDGKTYKQDTTAYSLVGWYEVDQDTGQLKGLYNFSGGVTGNTILRAVWRTVGEYSVKYSTQAVDFDGNTELDLNEEPVVLQDGTVPVDSSRYADKSNSSVGNAPTIIPNNYVFVGWYYDGTIYNPGDAFMLKAELADADKQIWLYPVVVRYEQLPVKTTHIHWYANYEDNAGHQIGTLTAENQIKDLTRDDPVQINTPVDILDIGTLLNGSTSYTGYKFLGWALSQNAAEPWLRLEDDGTYSMENGTVTGITKIAADENLPYDDLYAVWEKKTYTVTVQKVVDSSSAAHQQHPFTFVPSFSDAELPTEYQLNFSLTGQQTTVTPDEGDPITYYTQKTFENIPYGSTFSFTEGTYEDYEIESVKYTVEDADDTTKNVTDAASSNGATLTVDGNVTVTFTNKPKDADLTIIKTVTGGFGDTTREFKFEITFDGITNGDLYDCVYGNVNQLTAADGVLSFTLADSESITITLPTGKEISIAEVRLNEDDVETSRYQTTWSSDDVTVQPGADNKHASITLTDDTTVTVTNKLDPVAPTGYEVYKAPYLFMLLAGAALLLTAALRRKGGGSLD